MATCVIDRARIQLGRRHHHRVATTDPAASWRANYDLDDSCLIAGTAAADQRCSRPLTASLNTARITGARSESRTSAAWMPPVCSCAMRPLPIQVGKGILGWWCAWGPDRRGHTLGLGNAQVMDSVRKEPNVKTNKRCSKTKAQHEVY